MSTTKRGVAVTLADEREVIVPPFTFAQLEEHHDALGALTRPHLGLDREAIPKMLDIFHAALSRYHPEIARDEMPQLVDLVVATDFILAIGAVNQLRERLQAPGAPP